ncbi:hypothetical protein AVEN_223059-1 [Araneus ventricosus]|uniref:Uncharacterized protein n=1 Tax=Araneus ventricosus TaxID=182803 RepID=A0A4Y2FVF8_ARAVE|nr:hypothetical protein AVEN_223059-1 [Araneus ventricosus]
MVDGLLNSTLQGNPYRFNNVHVWGFRRTMKVSKVRRVSLEPHEPSLDVSEVPYQANCKRSIPPQRLYQIKQFPVDMLGPWIHEVVSIPEHVHPPDTIGNETRHIRQLVSSHQQFNGGVGEPRPGVKLCAVQSTTVHEWDIGSESPYQ